MVSARQAPAATEDDSAPSLPSPAATEDDPANWANPAVAGFSAVVAAAVVLRHIANKPLWRDEAISLSVARRPMARILTVLPHHDANAGLYYLLLHAWLWAGHERAWARGFSAACFIATAALAAWAVGRWRGWEAGLACGVLVAANPFLVYYGQEARPYALAVLLGAASTVAGFGRGPARPAPRVYVTATIALVYADLFAALYVAAVAAAIVAWHWHNHRHLPKALVRCWLIVAAVTAPLALLMMAFERGQISWLTRPSFSVLATTATAMGGGRLGLEVAAVLAVAAIAGATAAARRQEGLVTAALAAGAAVPPVALWTFSQITPSFIDRYVICSALALVGLTAAGLAVVRHVAGRAVAVAALVVALIAAGQRTAHLESEPYKVDDAPAVVELIRAEGRPGDAVAYAGGGLRTLVESSLAERTRPAFPTDITLAPGGESFRQHDLYAREVDATTLASRLVSVRRLWLITDASDGNYPQGGPFAVLRPEVTSAFARSSATRIGAIDVTLLARR